MTVEIDLRCAKCRNRVKDRYDLLFGLCESCSDRLQDKLDEVRRIDYDVAKEMMEKYNTNWIEEAWVIKKWGKPYRKITYTCDRCGRTITPDVADKNSIKHTSIFDQGYSYYCNSCMKRKEQEERKRTEDYNKRERDKFNSL